MSDLHKLKGSEAKRQEPLKRKKGLKLIRLPGLARIEVIRSMDIKEIIKISLCSRRMERMIRYAQVKVNKIEFHINMSNSTLGIESLNKTINPCGPHQLRDGSSNFRSRILSQLINKYSSFQNCLSIFKHLQNIISFNSLCLDVNFERMTVEYFKEILTEPILKDFGFLYIDQGEIDGESLDLVMGMANSNRHLRIDTKVPENYSHKNAFKFYFCSYWDARWVRIQDLFTLKNNDTVHLSWHTFSYSDMNNYIKYWIDSDHDMVRVMKLYTSEPIQPESLFDGIVVLKHPGIRGATYLVAANRTKQRKHQIMGVVWDDNRLRLYSWDKNEPIRFEENVYAESWAPEYKILIILNKKKELEGKLKQIQKLLETSQDQNLVKRKNEIAGELQNVSQEVASLNLVLRDGVYSYE